MNIHDDIALILAARAAAYRSFCTAIGREPTHEMLSMFNDVRFEQIVGLFMSEKNDELGLLLRELQTVSLEQIKNEPESLEQLSSAYCRLFIGPGKTEAGPWESIYQNQDGTLFQETTLSVRKSYVGEGFIPSNYPHVADDHVALELDFMALLAQQMVKSFDGRDFCKLKGDLHASMLFLDDHLLAWIPKFKAALDMSISSAFYGEVTGLLDKYILIDRTFLDEIETELRAELV